MTPGVLRAHDHARAEISRVDTKAGALLSLASAALAGVALLTQIRVPPQTLVGLWLTAAPVLAAVVVLLTAIRPRLSRQPTPGTWLHAAYHGPDGLTAERHQDKEVAAQDVCVLGKIAVTKMRRVRLAVDLLIVAAVMFVIALALSIV